MDDGSRCLLNRKKAEEKHKMQTEGRKRSNLHPMSHSLLSFTVRLEGEHAKCTSRAWSQISQWFP